MKTYSALNSIPFWLRLLSEISIDIDALETNQLLPFRTCFWSSSKFMYHLANRVLPARFWIRMKRIWNRRISHWNEAKPSCNPIDSLTILNYVNYVHSILNNTPSKLWPKITKNFSVLICVDVSPLNDSTKKKKCSLASAEGCQLQTAMCVCVQQS